MFVHESPTLYAAWVSAGENPIMPSMGTKIGARMSHFADPLEMNRLMVVVSRTKATISLLRLNSWISASRLR